VAHAVKLVVEGATLEYSSTRTARSTLALENINLEVRGGEFVCIVGPSGCGKTSFLAALDGLVPLSRGRFLIDGKPLQGPRRDVAMVFQNPSLLPWRTVVGNVIYGLELQGRNQKESQERVAQLLETVGLSGWEHSYPHELSGGMQQRVNIARAMAVDPEILLLDEPFANLDAQTREFMQEELLRLWDRTQMTALLVTHQISEAVYLGDRVVVLTRRPGRVKDVLEIELPRPRGLSIKKDPRFLEYEEHIWNHIVEEVAKDRLKQTDRPEETTAVKPEARPARRAREE